MTSEAIAGSADAGQYPEPLLAESSDAPTTLIWHSVKPFYACELHLFPTHRMVVALYLFCTRYPAFEWI